MFSPRHEITPYVFDSSLWVVGGNMWPLMNDVWRLTLPDGKEGGKPCLVGAWGGIVGAVADSDGNSDQLRLC